jgi:hypothetical protein
VTPEQSPFDTYICNLTDHSISLRYRVSQLELAFYSPTSKWDPSSFTTVQNFLPGIPSSDLFNEVTYPRFVNVDNNLLLTYRIGKAGLGSDVLYKYSSHTHTYSFLGAHLTGIASSPYINGLDYRLGRLHTSWTYRRFYEYNGSLDPTSSAHKFQAGPNGPENNYQLNYAYSDDEGLSWLSSKGVKIATVDGGKGEKQTILPSTEGITVFNIPMNSGILNQEGQCADWGGGFHVLNRENRSGRQKWIHYYRDPSGKALLRYLISHIYLSTTFPFSKSFWHNTSWIYRPLDLDRPLSTSRAHYNGYARKHLCRQREQSLHCPERECRQQYDYSESA